MVFIERPLSAVLLAIGVLLLVVVLLPTIRAKREDVFTE
jgi:TctA family transporter